MPLLAGYCGAEDLTKPYNVLNLFCFSSVASSEFVEF